MFAKNKQIKLRGKVLNELVALVYERDQHKCIVCHRWVEDGHKPHHVKYKSHGGGDTLDNMVLLCANCHYQVHHGTGGEKTKDLIERYLRWMQDEAYS